MAQVNDMVGAVLVVGGGIAGVQASLDLAESGIPSVPAGRKAMYRRCNGATGQDFSDQ